MNAYHKPKKKQKLGEYNVAKNKDQKKKEHLVHERNVNKKPPLWTYQKTKDRSLVRERKRQWRRSKLGKKIKTMVKNDH